MMIVYGGEDASDPHLSRPILEGPTLWEEWNTPKGRKPMNDWRHTFYKINPAEVYLAMPRDGGKFKWTEKTDLGYLLNRFGSEGVFAREHPEQDHYHTGYSNLACAFYVANKKELEDACVSLDQYLLLTSMETVAKEILDRPTLDDTLTIAWMDLKVFAACVSECSITICVQTLLGTQIKTTAFQQGCGFDAKRL